MSKVVFHKEKIVCCVFWPANVCFVWHSLIKIMSQMEKEGKMQKSDEYKSSILQAISLSLVFPINIIFQ